MRAGLAAAVLAAALCRAALAAGPTADQHGAVARVIDGATFALADGRTVRLAALDLPPPERHRALAEAARGTLAALVERREVGLAASGAGTDRYGRLVAHVVAPQGRWVQAEMVAKGLARVAIAAEDDAPLGLLLAREAEARQARRGLWALPQYRVLRADEAARFLDTMQLVEGEVRGVARNGGRVFLNFGADWRSDFTVLVPAAARRRFAGRGLDLEALQGQMVRVRGWIEWYNGPLIEIARPEQIEVIER